MRLHPCMTTSYGVPVRQAGTLPAQLVCSCASGFFQIPPCDGHPCLRLTIPTAKFVVVFHHLVIAHAGHTINETDDIRSIINATDEKALREAFRTSMSNLSRCVVIQRDPETGIIDQARKWMQEHFQENIQLDDAARSVGISPYYFSKLFKEQAGVNFIDYLTDLRMEKARDLLAHQNLSIKEVCVRCGYADQNYFSRIFKKTVGMTPTEYRNSK